MKFGRLARRTTFVLFLAVIPVLLVVKFRWDAILPVVIYLQLLLIWAQAEIALRQHSLFAIQFKPFFGISYRREINQILSHTIWIQNASKNAAYNMMVGRLLDKQNRPIPPSQWTDKLHSNLITSLVPNEEALLCSFNENLNDGEFTIEFSYFDQLGELGIVLINLAKDGKMLLIPQLDGPPGILLNTFGYFALLFKFISLKRH